jgi:hypothetical protein
LKARGRYRPGGELTVETSLLRDQSLAQWNGLGLHRGMALLHASALVLGQPELVAQFEGMDRGIVMSGWRPFGNVIVVDV